MQSWDLGGDGVVVLDDGIEIRIGHFIEDVVVVVHALSLPVVRYTSLVGCKVLQSSRNSDGWCIDVYDETGGEILRESVSQCLIMN